MGALKTIFVKLFQPFLAAFVASLHVVKNTAIALSNSVSEAPRWNFAEALEGWDAAFDKLLHGLENKVAEVGLLVRFTPICTDASRLRTASIAYALPLDHLPLRRALVPVMSILVGHISSSLCFRS